MISLVAIAGAVFALAYLGVVVIRQDREIRRLHRSFANVYRENDTLTESGWRTEVCAWMLDAATYYRDESEDETRPGGARLHSHIKAETVMEMIKGIQKKRYKAVTMAGGDPGGVS